MIKIQDAILNIFSPWPQCKAIWGWFNSTMNYLNTNFTYILILTLFGTRFFIVIIDIL